MKRARFDRAVSFLLLLGLLAAWQGICSVFDVPAFLLPAPMDVFAWLWRGFSLSPFNPASFWFNITVTLGEALGGFVVGCVTGTGLGLALAHSQRAERIFYPFIQAFAALPKIALAPLLLVWLGYGIDGKIVVAAILVFFPMLVNAMAGYHAVEPERIDLARICGASQVQIFRKIILPSALPYIFAGIHVAVVIAVLGALVGEFVGATAGLGTLLMQYNNNVQLGGVFAILVVLAALGFLLNLAVQALERHFCFWARRPKNFG